MMRRRAGAIDYALITTNSHSRMTLRVLPSGVRVFAPRHVRLKDADAFVRANSAWIEEARTALAARRAEEDISHLSARAKDEICARIASLAPLLGDRRPARVSIRAQRTRWGSCSQKHNLNFNYKLILAPPGALNYVVAHELCHLYEFNHSERFWRLVASICPDFAQWRGWLKLHGGEL